MLLLLLILLLLLLLLLLLSTAAAAAAAAAVVVVVVVFVRSDITVLERKVFYFLNTYTYYIFSVSECHLRLVFDLKIYIDNK